MNSTPCPIDCAVGGRCLVPSGCIEYHGPHLPFGVDTLIVEELCQRVAGRVDAVVAPPFWYGPTGYAVSGPERGTVDVSTERFGRHVKDVLASFWDIGFKWIIVCQHHQQLDGPEALAIRQAAAEVTFEKTHAERGHAWWGKAPLPLGDNVFERIQVWPSVLPAAAERAGVVMADHAGFYETALILGRQTATWSTWAGWGWMRRGTPTRRVQGTQGHPRSRGADVRRHGRRMGRKADCYAASEAADAERCDDQRACSRTFQDSE